MKFLGWGCSKANPGRIAPRQHQFIDQKLSILLINPVKKKKACSPYQNSFLSLVVFILFIIMILILDVLMVYLGFYSSPVKLKGFFFHPSQIVADYHAALFWLDLEACIIPLDDIFNNVILFLNLLQFFIPPFAII